MGFATPGEGLSAVPAVSGPMRYIALVGATYAWEHPLRNFSFRNECWFSPSTKQLQPSPPGELPKTERYNTPPAERRTNSLPTCEASNGSEFVRPRSGRPLPKGGGAARVSARGGGASAHWQVPVVNSFWAIFASFAFFAFSLSCDLASRLLSAGCGSRLRGDLCFLLASRLATCVSPSWMLRGSFSFSAQSQPAMNANVPYNLTLRESV